MRLRRSLLICPANRPDLLAKLTRSDQDVAVLCLEDAVHEAEKEAARRDFVATVTALEWKCERLVRINPMATAHAPEDIKVAVQAGVDGIMLAKTQSADELKRASALLAEAERANGVPEGRTRLWSMVESALGLLRIEDICFADPRMSGVLFGGGDLAVDLQIKRFGLGPFRRTGIPFNEYTYGRGKVVLAARAAGITPIDTGNTAFGDEWRTRQYAEFSAQMGFAGAVVYSPRQVPWINETFNPASEDIRWAQEVVKKTDEASTGNKTVVVIDGEMIDGPFVLHARQILERARAAGLARQA